MIKEKVYEIVFSIGLGLIFIGVYYFGIKE